MARPKLEIPDLQNQTPTSLIDQIGRDSAMFNYLKKRIDLYKVNFWEKAGGKQFYEDPFVGEVYTGRVGEHLMTTVDQDKIKEKFPQDEFPMFYKTIPVITLRTGSDQDPEFDKWLKNLQEELDLP